MDEIKGKVELGSSRIYNFDVDALFLNALKDFIKISKFDLSNKRQTKLYEQSLSLFIEKKAFLNPQGIIACLAGSVFKGKTIELDDIKIDCDYFSMIPDKAVERIYMYIVTAGCDIPADNSNLADMVFSDIWGTAYVDTVTDIIQAYIIEYINQDGLYPSQCFGPGYYGMSVLNAIAIHNVVGGKK